MTLQLSIEGVRYDDSEPLYLSTVEGTLLFNRVMRTWVSWASLQARAAAESYTWANREIGIPSIPWLLTHRNMDFSWGPGLDDTSGLASEAVVNGEAWTDASGSTPPTGWTVDGLAPNFAINAGVLHFDQTGAGDHTMSQTLTVVAGTTYVLEVRVAAGTQDVTMTFAGYTFNLKAGADFAVSYTATGTSVDIDFDVGGDGDLYLDYVRLYEEAELTGGGTAIARGPVNPIEPDPVKGPYASGSTDFWIDTQQCMVGFDVDSDPEPDIWLTPQEVCDAKIEDSVKIGINAQLIADGCDGLPCMTKAGGIKAKNHWESVY